MTDYKYWERFDDVSVSAAIDLQDEQRSVKDAKSKSMSKSLAASEATMRNMQTASEILQSQVFIVATILTTPLVNEIKL